MTYMELRMIQRPFRTGAALLGAVALLTACGGGDEDSGTPASESSTTSDSATSSGSESAATKITISDFEYSVPESVPAGAKITVTNSDDVGHTVTTDTGDTFDEAVGGGETVTFTAPDKAGEYPFHCTPHPRMTSTLVVE